MSSKLLDEQIDSGKGIDGEMLPEYAEILKNPDLLGRLFRIFVFKHTRSSLWKDSLNAYLERNIYKSKAWHVDRRTNLDRTLFDHSTVTWRKFLEGLVILSPAYDEMTFNVASTLNNGEVTSIKIKNATLDVYEQTDVRALPSGKILIPDDFYRSPLEPLPLKIVRDALTGIETVSDFRKIIRKNLAGTIHEEKMSSTVNSLYVSIMKKDMSWKRMTAILFALGATQLIVTIVAKKDGKEFKAIVQVNR